MLPSYRIAARIAPSSGECEHMFAMLRHGLPRQGRAAGASARMLRAQNLTLADIATELGVSKSSVSLWVRDVPFTPSKRRHGPQRRPHAQRVAKLARDRGARTPQAATTIGSSERRCVPRCWRRACTPGRARSERAASLREHRSRDDPASSAPGCDGSSSRTKPGSEFASTCIEGLDSKQPSVLVGPDGDSARAVQQGVPGDCRSEHPAKQARTRLCVRRSTRARRPTAEIMGLVRALLSSERHSGVAQSAEHSAC